MGRKLSDNIKIKIRNSHLAKYPHLMHLTKREKAFKDEIKMKYGIESLEELDWYRIIGQNRCWICKREFNSTPGRSTRMCIDHKHGTKKVRGLLCQDCNITLGIVKENIVTLKTMIAYLE